MLIQILFFLALGILAGTITGLIPGIHINLISTLLVSIGGAVYFEPIYAITFVSSMAITHTFLDFIPSIFLGCPDTETELSVLPGHKLLKNKRGYEAVQLSNIGSLIAIFLTVIILFPSIMILQKFYQKIQHLIPYILIFILIILILSEKRKINALFVLFITGLLGYTSMNLSISQPLLPLLTGLFGASNIILSIKNKTEIPEQIITKPKTKLLKPILGSIISAPLCSFLPGMGAGQAAIIGNSLTKNTQKQFLVLLGITNTLVMSFSFISLYLIQKTRTGAALAIKNLLGNLSLNYLILIILIVLVSGTIAFYLTSMIAKKIAMKIRKINYQKLSVITLISLMVIILLVSGALGLILFAISTLTGIYCINLKVRRTNMMGVLLIPTILFYLLR